MMKRQRHAFVSCIFTITSLLLRVNVLHSLQLGSISPLRWRAKFSQGRSPSTIAQEGSSFPLYVRNKNHNILSSYRSNRRKGGGDVKRNGSRWRRRRSSKVWYSDSNEMDEGDRNTYVNRAISKSFGKVLRKKAKRPNQDDIALSVSVYAESNGLAELNDDPIADTNSRSNLSSDISSNDMNRSNSTEGSNVVRNVHDLRKAILHNGYKLEEIELESIYAESKNTDLKDDLQFDTTPGNTINATNDLDLGNALDHKVLELIKHRILNNSKPGSRAKNDTSVLALSIEGGGMRGSVSAGMASAIATLGLCDAFDSIYGSSAGSVVGAYMISRQMCVDVYTDLLPVARKIFVSKLRLVSSLIVSVVDNLLTSTSLKNFDLISRQTPAMNISFVLDGIMDPHAGLRPLDLTSFQTNDQKQPLRVVSSAVKDGKMDTVCFGAKEGDFFSNGDNHNDVTISVDKNARRGLFACLEASMTVPGATGPPINLKQRSRNLNTSGNSKEEASISACFDAFCFEPLPYRSAVEEGATHVLVLRSRSEGCTVKTKPGMYEKTVAPIYFKSNGHPQVAQYFKEGGQQYRYLEDVMTLDDGRMNDHLHPDGVPVPPTEIYYGSQEYSNIRKDESQDNEQVNFDSWKKAHLLPIAVPASKGELSNLENGKDEVLQAVRDGFAAAFDILAPVAGLELDSQLTGDRVAELVFPKRELLGTILDNPVIVEGEMIPEVSLNDSNYDDLQDNLEMRKKKRHRLKMWLERSILNRSKSRANKKRNRKMDSNSSFSEDEYEGDLSTDSLSKTITTLNLDEDTLQRIETEFNLSEYDPLDSQQDAIKLLSCLPGLQAGKFSSLSTGLQMVAEKKEVK